MRKLLAVPLCFLVGLALPCHAARPHTTDDAALQQDKACQVEAWVDRSRAATQSWFAPACNFGANIEWQAGFARTHEEGRSVFSDAYAQGKTVFLSLDDSPWGYGLTVGVSRFARRESHNGWENPYAIIPVSMTPDGGTTLFHFNVGWSHDRAKDRHATLWGVAGETAVTPRLTLLAEAYGENAAKPFVRAGGRFTVIKDRLDVDLSVVGRPGGTRAERFVSLGLFWQSGRFLP